MRHSTGNVQVFVHRVMVRAADTRIVLQRLRMQAVRMTLFARRKRNILLNSLTVSVPTKAGLLTACELHSCLLLRLLCGLGAMGKVFLLSDVSESPKMQDAHQKTAFLSKGLVLETIPGLL